MMIDSCQHRLSPVRQLVRLCCCCCCCIIICVTLATVASSASTAKAKALSTGQLNDKTAEAEHTDSATSDAETQSRISPLDVTSGLAMLPKMKPQKDKSDENIDEPQTSEDYYYSAEYPEPETDDVDVEMLERFIELLGQQQGSVSADDVGSDDLIPARDDNAQAPNTSSEYDGKAEKETEMTSSADERDKRSVGDHVQMTAEHMVPGGEDAKVNRAVRLKRDLTSRRWIDADDYDLPVTDDNEEFGVGRPEEDFADPTGTYTEDYDDDDGDEQRPMSKAQLLRYMQLLRAVEQMNEPSYLPVVYRGVKGIFVPQSSIATYQTAAGRRQYPPSLDELESAADRWSGLVREEVKKALDEYDLVYRLADALRKRRGT